MNFTWALSVNQRVNIYSAAGFGSPLGQGMIWEELQGLYYQVYVLENWDAVRYVHGNNDNSQIIKIHYTLVGKV